MPFGLDPEKYIVMKKTDKPFTAEDEDVSVAGAGYDPLEPDTFFVLRDKDIASIGAVRAYVNGLMLMLDAMTLAPDERTHLTELADHVAALADRWERGNQRHVPD
jgi:hypothetical protein